VRILAPVGDVTAPLARRNPVAKLSAMFVLTIALLVAVDPVTPAVALAAELAVVPLFGVRYRALLRRSTVLLLSVAGIALTQLLFGTSRTGPVLIDAGPLVVTTGVAVAALGLGLRIVAVALPGMVVVATTDPTDLADSLTQQLKVPARFAIGALAAFRLLPLLAEEWEQLTLARRARGVDAGRNPLAYLKLVASTTFALLVSAIRRGTRLATAMDARGFDSQAPRSVARRQRFTAADAAVIVGAAAVASAAIATSIATGAFRFFM
jgi:energy-coupling factor transport system permease protein